MMNEEIDEALLLGRDRKRSGPVKRTIIDEDDFYWLYSLLLDGPKAFHQIVHAVEHGKDNGNRGR